MSPDQPSKGDVDQVQRYRGGVGSERGGEGAKAEGSEFNTLFAVTVFRIHHVLGRLGFASGLFQRRGIGGGGSRFWLPKLSGYDDRSLVSASVSSDARWRPRNDDGGDDEDDALSVPFPESIWKGNDPSPVENADDCDATDMPAAFLFTGLGGGGSGDTGASRMLSRGGGSRAESGGAVLLFVAKLCCARGERGGVRIGLFDIGDGGTKGKLSRIESAFVDADETTEASDIRLWFGSISCIARCCCCSSAPPPLPEAGVLMRRALVRR